MKYIKTLLLGASILLSVTANNSVAAPDTAKPTVTVTAPKKNLQTTNGTVNATGTAKDNVAVAAVYYQFNGGAWAPANGTTNWSVTNLSLVPGTNTIRVYAVDTSTNYSTTNTVIFTYVVKVPITVQTNGSGTVTPNYNGQSLQIQKTYKMMAKAAKGFGFVNWTGSTNTASSKLTFLMASNLIYTANFADNARPALAIIFPAVKHSVSNSPITSTGKASDNVGVAVVYYRLNGGAWQVASLAGDGTNWSAANLTLNVGSNSISAYAQDAVGNTSLTNTVVFTYVVPPDFAPDSVSGLTATVTPHGGDKVTVCFGATTMSQFGTGTNEDNYGVGNYTYTKTGTNAGQLAISFTAPPLITNDTPHLVDLAFTGNNSCTFSNRDGGDTGTITFAAAVATAPASLSGKTIHVSTRHGSGTIVLATTTFTLTFGPNMNSGNYTYVQYGPVGGMLIMTHTDVATAGEVDYVQVKFTAAKAGNFFFTSFENSGTLMSIDTGSFTTN